MALYNNASMFEWDETPPSQDDIDYAEAELEILHATKRFSSQPAKCHSFMSVFNSLSESYAGYMRGKPVKARAFASASQIITQRHLGARGDATHEDICMFAPEHGAGLGDRPRRRR